MDLAETVCTSEIADMTGYKPVTIGRWMDQHDDFPDPVRIFGGLQHRQGFAVFSRSEVKAWLVKHKKPII